MDALQGTRRRSYFIATSLEAYLATEEGKKMAMQIMGAAGRTKAEAKESAETKNSGQLGFDLDSILS